jgi:hypothetical protein
VIDRLTANAWRHSPPAVPPGSEESVTWVFFGNSTFESIYRSDYVVERNGAWAVSSSDLEPSVLFIRDSSAGNRSQPIAQVLSFEFGERHLELAHRRYEPVELTGPSSAKVNASGGSPLQSLQSDPAFALWKKMTNARWRIEGTPSIADPDEISFRSDGTYTARFGRIECSYDGSWSLSVHDESTGTASLWIPANRCDPRRAEIAAVLERPVTLQDGRLFLSKTPYVAGYANEERP